MTLLSELFAVTGGGVIKRQQFNASGTFTPSAALLAKGGWVAVTVQGGGGNGGAPYGSENRVAGGGSSGCRIERTMQIAGAVTVTVGAAEGESSFGGVAAAPGLRGGNATGSAVGTPAASAGQGSNPGIGAIGGNGLLRGGVRPSTPPIANGGGGGLGRTGGEAASLGDGASGMVLVEWIE